MHFQYLMYSQDLIIQFSVLEGPSFSSADTEEERHKQVSPLRLCCQSALCPLEATPKAVPLCTLLTRDPTDCWVLLPPGACGMWQAPNLLPSPPHPVSLHSPQPTDKLLPHQKQFRELWLLPCQLAAQCTAGIAGDVWYHLHHKNRSNNSRKNLC